ncbi:MULTISPECIES: flagellar biosynthesis regulator FlaF [unclassified Yoonia]|uniref:flagellar biosynthesis regulator FlaF n=1 Tax=unclassified Yoonia TaxID=2629118 RepID=UPI002AFEB360|nr:MULTISPECIES: flagellar biosynthesis regulator FlaF [unclassified Yoonia]
MNAIEQARQAYAPTAVATRTDRAVEAQLFGQITARLRNAMSDQPQNFAALVAAISDNRRLWSTLAASVADKDNQLPAQLRAQIFYLAEFTEYHSQKVLRNSASADVLVDINTAVMRGLNGQGKP